MMSINRQSLAILALVFFGNGLNSHASEPGRGGRILPQRGQLFVGEPASLLADELIQLTPREREIHSGENPPQFAQFGARANHRGVEGLRLSINLFDPVPISPMWPSLQPSYRKILEEEVYRLTATQLYGAGIAVLGPGAKPQKEFSVLPAAGQIPWMQARRPFLGEGILNKPTPASSRPPSKETRPNVPDLNRLVLSLDFAPFTDQKAALVVRTSFERPLADPRFPAYQHFSPATVWQGVAHRQEVSWPPAASELSPMVEAAVREWLLALAYAAPSPERLTDAAHLPGIHREALYAPGTGRMAPWEENKHMLPWPVQAERPPLGLDNFLCDGAGRRWNPLDSQVDPCARFPHEQP